MILSQNAGGGVSFYLLKNKKAFTLVEMMVVVVIISILATIWFLRLGNYSSEANVAKRASDKKNIEQVLEMYKSKEWEYPEFEEENGEKIFWTWTWEKVKNRLPVMPIDPITKKPYKIAFLPSWKYGKIAMVDLDGEIARANPENTKNILPETEATNQLDLTALIAIQGKVAEKLRELVWLDKTASENNFVQSVNGKVQESKALVDRVYNMIREKDFEETKVNSTRDEINDKKRELTDLLKQIESKINKFKWDEQALTNAKNTAIQEIERIAREEIGKVNTSGLSQSEKTDLIDRINTAKATAIWDINRASSESNVTQAKNTWAEEIRKIYRDHNAAKERERQQALTNAKNTAKQEIERIAREEIGKVNTSGLSQSEKTDLIDRINTAKATAIWNINRANSESNVTQAKNTWVGEIRLVYNLKLDSVKHLAVDEIKSFVMYIITWMEYDHLPASFRNRVQQVWKTVEADIINANTIEKVTELKNAWFAEIRRIEKSELALAELESEKTKLRNRITVLEKVNKTGKTQESVNAFNTKVNSAKTLLNKAWVTKQEITNKINELVNLEKTLVNTKSPFSPNGIYIGEPESDTCVRKIPGRFIVNWPMITDTRTGLVWSKDTASWKNWQEAKDYCANLTTWWKTNWRLPDITELNSIVNDSCDSPATYYEFKTVESRGYRSSTTHANSIGGFWALFFGSGNTFWISKTYYSNYVLCVTK